jgi:LPLT family lysophospholipid transporter-like MFS transporter
VPEVRDSSGVRDAALPGLTLLSPAMAALLVAEFLSALADNAILVAAIEVFKQGGASAQIPRLQAVFVIPFIVFAPFVGALADALPKSRVMLAANLFKLAGAVAMAAGASPLAMYALVGVGAAAYSPAKYGILTQMFDTGRLVRANGMLEGSTIVAILLGVVLGGFLADRSLGWAFGGVITCYSIATLANLRIPRLPAEAAGQPLTPGPLLRRFIVGLRTMFADRDACFSLLGTSIFWGAGSTLRLMLFAWVPAVLLLTDNGTPANLMGVLSVGIVGGSIAAGAWVSLAKVNRALIGGILLGPLVIAMAVVSSLGGAAAVMAAIGFFGGCFVVPLNALLQRRGHQSIGAGSALAVQNFSENLAMLAFVGIYSALASAGVGVRSTAAGFGAVLFGAVALIAFWRLAGPTGTRAGVRNAQP